MDSTESLTTDELELAIAKARLRLAAERAEPARLLRQGVRDSPLSAVASASLAGAAMAFLGKRDRQGSVTTRLLELLLPVLSGLAAGSRERK